MKGISSIGAILILIVGLAMTGITIYGYMHDEIFLNDTTTRNIILYIMSGADFCIILGSILGMCGVKKGNGCLIGIFQLFVIIFMLVFASLGVVSEYAP